MVEEEEKGNRRVEGWEVGEGKKGKKKEALRRQRSKVAGARGAGRVGNVH
jgi:hypothetical protein